MVFTHLQNLPYIPNGSKLLSLKHNRRIACWNVKSLAKASNQRELLQDLSTYNISICGLSETRWSLEGEWKDQVTNWSFLCSKAKQKSIHAKVNMV